jgi:(p)ppGpp synthase/HD superfamily hydrolase
MHAVTHLGETAMAAAVLHDMLEDTDSSPESLREEGLPPEVIRLVSLCTRNPGEAYMDYVLRLSPDPVARAIKMADLKHNMAPERLACLTDQDLGRIRKYHEACRFLEGLGRDHQ